MTTGRRESCAPCKLLLDPPRDGIIRTSPGSEGSKDKGALPGTRGVLLYVDAIHIVSITLGLHFYNFCGVLAALGENRTQMSARGRKVQV